ncbi:MAG: hypothetical protein AAB036_11840 [Elusimicrobiota bacterium]
MKTHRAEPHEKPHHAHWPLEVLLFAFVFALGWRSVHAPQTWIHVKTGGGIISERAVPVLDPFSYGSAGGAWTTDSWLFDVTAARLDSWGGPSLLIAVKSFVAAAAFALLLPINHASPLTAATLLAFGACAGWAGLVEIPAIFDLLFFALFLRLLRPRDPLSWVQGIAAVLLTALWANVHGASALLAVWFAGLKTFKTSLRTTTSERLGYWSMLGACLLAFSFNPHGWSLAGRTFSDASAVAGGWPAPWLSLYTVFIIAGLASCWMTLQQEFVMTMAAATVISLSLVLPGMRLLAILASCPVIALTFGQRLKGRVDTLPRVLRWSVFSALLFAGYRHFISEPFSHARGYGFPRLAGAVHYLESNGVRGRMFNEPDAGAELIGLSRRPVFIDERAGVYADSFRTEAAAWPRSFRQLDMVYRFDYAVLLNRRAGAPARIIDEDPAWRLGYADDHALVYLKTTGLNAELSRRSSPRLFSPNRPWPDELDASLTDPHKAARILRELDAWIVEEPDCIQALIWKAYALARLGRSSESDRYLDFVRERPRFKRDGELRAAYAFVLKARGRVQEAAR